MARSAQAEVWYPAAVWDRVPARFSARRLLPPRARPAGAGLLLLLLAGLLFEASLTLALIVAGATMLLAASLAFRLGLALAAPNPVQAGPRLPADILPRYTVMAALYREARVVRQFLAGLAQLDYPRDRLQVLLALEADDHETWTAARHAAAQHPDLDVQLIPVPGAGPRTKPKALNVALAEATGVHLVVFDAEDLPEPGQLREAASAFARSPDLGCVQARLNVYNLREGLLTRLFGLDYAVWFDLVQRGLARARLPVPLGGTSNHFRTDVLRAAGAWDPYNVTEDADLGLRLARLGVRVGVISSTTWEEAPTTLPAWLRQRARWMKGFLQTSLVHLRSPRQTHAELGLRGVAALVLMVTAPVMVALAWPILLVWSLGLLTGAVAPWPGPVALVAGGLLAAGTGAVVGLHAVAARRRGWHDLQATALAVPLLWLLTAIAAWMGLVSLIRAPRYWAKTEHGVTRCRPHVPAAGAAAE